MLFKDYKHIELVEDSVKITPNRIEDGKISNIKNWTPESFLLRVVAVVTKGTGDNRKRKVKKRIFSFNNVTMKSALDEVVIAHKLLLKEIKAEWSTEEIITKVSTKMPTFKEALSASLDQRELDAAADNEKFKGRRDIEAFNKNYLTTLADIPMDKITTAMLTKIRANMKGKDGKPMAKRTKLKVLQYVNPAYTWLNENTDFIVKSPAKIKKGTTSKLKNERKVKVEDIGPLFNEMYNYPLEPFRSIFTWILHGRRVNEVLTLDWSNINLKAGTYTIVDENNKAGISMTYKLTQYQLDTLPTKKRRGIVFPSINDPKKVMNQGTLRNHWEIVRKSVGEWTLNDKEATPEEFHLHDIRHLLGGAMVNNNVVDEISGAVLGHVRSNITARYAEILTETANDAICGVLDGVLK